MSERVGERGGTPAAALIGVVLTALGVGTRMTASMDPFPGWSGDPLLMETPIVGLTPVGSLAVDGVIVLGAGLVLAGMARAGRGARGWEAALALGGVAAAGWHGWVHEGGSLQDLVLGATWCAGVLAGLAACVAGRDERLRGLLGAVVLALAAPLLLRGIVQVRVEHPDVVEAFRSDKAAILAAHGWSAESPMARAYERRLSQAEASGWFGLANVYATVMAASGAGLLGVVLGSGRRGRRGATLALLCGAAAGLAGVLLAGSKGGWAACALGVGMALTGRWCPAEWRGRAGAAVGVGVVGAALGAVVARGVLGERIGELSLLFRWFYMEGAGRVVAAWPVLGVGPTGFKEAYALLKPAISPEDVSSPHSVLLDFAATLGVGGMMWGVLWLGWVRRAGAGLMGKTGEGAPGVAEGAGSFRGDLSLAAIMVVVAALSGSMLEQALASPTTALVRVGGAVLGIGLAGAVLWKGRGRGLRLGLGAAALAAAAHTQIEMTAVTPGSCAWVMVLVGLAAGCAEGEDRARGRGAWGAWAGAGLCALVVAAIGARLGRVQRWEGALRRGYEAVQVVAELEGRMRRVDRGGTTDTRGRIVEDLAAALREPMLLSRALTGEDVTSAVLRLRMARTETALAELREAAGAWPTDLATVQALSRLELLQASQMQAARAKPGEVAGRVEAALRAAGLYSGKKGATAWAWLGTTHEAAAELTGNPAELGAAVECWARAAEGAPHAVLHPMQLARACGKLGKKKEAAAWAARALENDAKSRLDPLAGLGEAGRREMEALARTNE